MDLSAKPASVALARRLFSALVILCLLGSALGCRTGYRITLNNGTTITSANKPSFDEEASVWRFKDAQGQKHALPAFRVQEISPL